MIEFLFMTAFKCLHEITMLVYFFNEHVYNLNSFHFTHAMHAL